MLRLRKEHEGAFQFFFVKRDRFFTSSCIKALIALLLVHALFFSLFSLKEIRGVKDPFQDAPFTFVITSDIHQEKNFFTPYSFLFLPNPSPKLDEEMDSSLQPLSFIKPKLVRKEGIDVFPQDRAPLKQVPLLYFSGGLTLKKTPLHKTLFARGSLYVDCKTGKVFSFDSIEANDERKLAHFMSSLQFFPVKGHLVHAEFEVFLP